MAGAQLSFTETMFVYTCLECPMTYWQTDPPRKYHSLPCECCGHDCVCVDTFEFSPFEMDALDDYEQDPDMPPEPDQPFDRQRVIADRHGNGW